MLPCDFTVASQKHLSAVIVIFSSTIHHVSELKCNNSLFTKIILFLCLSCNNHSSSHCRSEKYQSRICADYWLREIKKAGDKVNIRLNGILLAQAKLSALSEVLKLSIIHTVDRGTANFGVLY